jgi:hypothetical protein
MKERRETPAATRLGPRKLEAHGEELAQLVIDAARRGDWRAAAFLYERVYGRPKEDVRVELPASIEDVDRLSASELEALRKRVLRDFPHLRVVGAPSVPRGADAASHQG